MKNRMLSIAACVVILALVIVGIWPSVKENILPNLPTAPEEMLSTDQSGNDQTNTAVMPKNVLQIGDSFEFYPQKADGHFLCTVTGVRLVTEESQCPAQEKISDYMMLCAYPDGKDRIYRYNEWFTEDGAFDLGARIMLVDLSVTNVDAVAWLDKGTFTSDCGWFTDPYAFYAHDIVQCADLTNPQGKGEHQSFGGPTAEYFSRQGEYAEEDIRDTLGNEPSAIQILPGQTVTYTLGFPIHGEPDGKTANLSKQWLMVGADGDVNTGVFIDTKLGDDVE